MVAEVATNTVSVLRGTGLDAYGDVIDSGQVFLSGVPACLIETASRTWDPATQTPFTVRTLIGHVPAFAGVLNSDQILNEQTGDKYIIESVEEPPTLTGAPVDTRLTLRRVTGTGP